MQPYQLYNDGIIVQDFATDTDESVHKSNIAAGKVAFFLDDNSTQWENIHTLNNDLDKSTYHTSARIRYGYLRSPE